jgi:cytochrome c peroxidase
MGIADFQANRSPDKRDRTTPLKGLFAHQKGGFFHDGRFPTLGDVVSHYDRHLSLRPYRGAIAGSRRVSQVALTPGAQEADDEATRERR